MARGMKFGTVYADPPWPYENQGTRAATSHHYGGMAVEDIAALPIAHLATENAHLHLWTTNAFLFEGKTILEAWGFEYKSCFVWTKPQLGIGNYWRLAHEFLLLGVRGSCPFLDRGQISWLHEPRGPHSAKPERIRELVEKVSPGPRLELFARRLTQDLLAPESILKKFFDGDTVKLPDFDHQAHVCVGATVKVGQRLSI